MRRLRWTKILNVIMLAGLLVLATAGASSAVEFRLRAQETTKTMPDGTVVTMWGFANDTGGISRPVTVPGPVLTVPAGDTTLTIMLENNLSVPVSIVIPGQTAVMTPVKVNGRVRSFTHETAPGNATLVTYTWTNMKPGTYLYQSGTDPSVQVQMGLYGAVKKDRALGMAYNSAAAAYNKDVVLLFSEIDPVLHDAVATGNYGPGLAKTSTMGYEPKYFLINGVPFSPGIDALPAGVPNNRVLLRFLNAGLHDHVPALEGLPLTVLTEDGNLYPYPREQSSVLLPAGKTTDAIIRPTAAGYHPVFDRRRDLTNAAASNGGMLTYLKVASAQSTLTVTKGVRIAGDTGSGTVIAASLPGGIDCGPNCSAGYNQGTVLTLRAVPTPGSQLHQWTGACTGTGDCTLAMTANKAVKAVFTFVGPQLVVTPTSKNFGSVGAGTLSMPQRFTIKNDGIIDLNVSSMAFSGTNAAEFSISNDTCTGVPVVPTGTCTVDVTFAPASAGTKTASLDIVSDSPGSPKHVTLSGSGFAQKVGVLSPNGGEVWPAGSSQTIQWRADPTVTGVNLYVTMNNGFTWTLINTTGKITGATTYPWTVPTPLATRTKCRVKVIGYAGTVAVGNDVSNGLFTIQVP